ATVEVDANPFPTHTDPDVGDFHRLLLPGDYTLGISAAGYAPAAIPVQASTITAARYDVALVPLPTVLVATARRVIDGEAEPGEAVDLAVTLTNSGRAATGVSASLVPTGWYGDVTRAQATYLEIPTGGSGESESPHFGIAIDAATPAGHKAGYAVQWTADQGSGASGPIFVDVGAPACDSVAASDVPLPIDDQSTTSSTLDLPLDIELSRVEVSVDLTHTYIGDLRLVLRSPTGTDIVLHDGSGGAATEISGTYGVDLTPVDSLELLVGEPALGAWTLEVHDEAPTDTGTLNGWVLSPCGRPVEAHPPEMRLRELAVVGDTLQLDWWPYPGLDGYRVYRSTTASDWDGFSDVTGADADPADTRFVDDASGVIHFYLVTGVGPRGEGPLGHFGR
ncbi:MAG TPA: proprotein convertase P-domain-containing protein, partial [Candidatus Polarisedimenticolaceae bacterium]|nr:proprotein convertase P-domain-containing protein [Candidatus Polarisedimenticolaceae bacterium]